MPGQDWSEHARDDVSKLGPVISKTPVGNDFSFAGHLGALFRSINILHIPSLRETQIINPLPTATLSGASKRHGMSDPAKELHCNIQKGWYEEPSITSRLNCDTVFHLHLSSCVGQSLPVKRSLPTISSGT